MLNIPSFIIPQKRIKNLHFITFQDIGIVRVRKMEKNKKKKKFRSKLSKAASTRLSSKIYFSVRPHARTHASRFFPFGLAIFKNTRRLWRWGDKQQTVDMFPVFLFFISLSLYLFIPFIILKRKRFEQWVNE